MGTICNLEQNKELAKSLGTYLHIRMQESLKSNQPFRLSKVMDEIYKLAYSKDKDNIKALGIAGVLPAIFINMGARKPFFFNSILKKGSKLDPIIELNNQINAESDPIKIIADFIAKGTIAGVSEVISKNTNTEVNEKAVVKKTPTLGLIQDLKLIVPTLFSTTGVSQVKYNKASSTFESEPAKRASYNALQNLIVAKDNSIVASYEDLEYDGHTGFKLRAVVEKNLPNPEKNIYSETLNSVSVVVAVTDNDGNYLYFDDNGKLATEETGKIAYYRLRKTDEQTKNAIIDAALSMSIAGSKLSKEEIEKERAFIAKEIEAEAKEIENIKKEASSTDKKVMLDILNSSKIGSIDQDIPQKDRTLSNFDLSPKEISTVGELRNFKVGNIELTLPSITFDNGITIQLYGSKIKESTPELFDNLINLLIDDVVRPDGTPVAASEKIAIFKQFFFPLDEEAKAKQNKLKLFEKNGEIVMSIGDNIISTVDKEAAKQKLSDFLGKEGYHSYIKKQNNIYIDFNIADNILYTEEKFYNDFIFKLVSPKIMLDVLTKRPMINNGYFNFVRSIDKEQVDNIAKKAIEKAKDTVKDKKLDLGDWDTYERSKLIQDTYTPEQVANADAWKEVTPLFKIKVDGKPVITIDEAIAITNSDAFATFANATITLYKGSNSTHLYHEAWHAFSQIFLKEAERTKLYKAAATLNTSFTYVKKSGTAGGQFQETVKVKLNELDPTNKQDRKILEEFIAEEFRVFAMNNGKFKVETEQTNIFKKIFNKIWALLKGLFVGQSLTSVYSNPGSSSIFDEMFSTLYNAKKEEDLNMFQPNIKNAEFGSLNTGSIKDEEGNVVLNDVESELLSKSIDGLIGQIINQLTTDNSLYGAGLIILSNRKALDKLYNVTIKKALSDRLDELVKEYEENQQLYNDIENNYHINNIDTLAKAIENFGDINEIIDNTADKESVISYHIRNSVFKDKIIDAVKEPTDIGSTSVPDILSRNDKKANDFKSEDIASASAKYMIESLVQEEYVDNKTRRVYKLNKLGFPQVIDFSSFWNILMPKVGGEKNEIDLYNTLVDVANKKITPLVDQLLQRLGKPENMLANKKAAKIWLGMIRSLNLQRINFINNLFEETLVSLGEDKSKIELTVTSGKITADYNNIKNNIWNNRFNLDSGAYVFINENKQNQLNLEKIVNKFIVAYTDNNDNIKYRLKEDMGDGRPADPIEFLNSVGIYMSDNIDVKSEIKSKQIDYLANAIGLANFNQIPITNPVDFFTSSRSLFTQVKEEGKIVTSKNKSKLEANTSIINSLALLEAEYSTTYGSQMVVLPSGEGLKSVNSLNSTTSRMVYAVNKSGNVKDLDNPANDNGYFPNYNADRNPAVVGSILRKSLYNSITGERNKDNFLVLEELAGSQYKNYQGSTEGLSHEEMNENDKFLSDLVGFLSVGDIEAVRSGEKATYYAIKANKIVTSPLYDKKSNHLYFDIEDFLSDAYGNSVTGNDINKIMKELMLKKLEGELRRIKKIKGGITELEAVQLGLKPEDAKDFYKNNVKGFENLTMLDWFDEILDSKEYGDKLKKDLIENYSNNLNDSNSLFDLLVQTEEGKKLKTEIEKQTMLYFDKLAQDFKEKNYKPLFNDKLPTFLKTLGTKKLTETQKQKVDDNAVINALMMAFAVNSSIHSDEIITLIFGDGLQFNHKKAESTKRVPTYNSPGIIFSTGSISVAAISKFYSRGYEQKLIEQGVITDRTAPRPFEKVGQKAIIKEPVVSTPKYKQYHDLFRTVLSKRNYTEEQVDKLLYGDGTYDEPGKNSIMEGWKEIKKADGQGYVTLDYYRMLKGNEDNWSDKQEALYQKIINNEYVSAKDIEEIFPVYKLQYAGPLSLPGNIYPIQSIDKFSLLPLIPSLTEDNYLDTIHKEMIKQGVDYILFDSGAKRSYIKSGESNGDEIFVGTNTTTLSSDIKFTKNPFYVEYLKNQTEVNNYFKEKATFATQFRKLFDVTLYENGVPVDYTGSESWKSLSNSEKEKQSEVYKYTEAALNSALRLQNQLKLDLYEEFGYDIEDGIPVESEQTMLEMIDYLKTKLLEQGYTTHELEAFNTDDEDSDLDLSTSPIAARLEKFMFSIVNNKLVRVKVNGEPFVQVSNAFFHKFTKPTDEEQKLYDDFEEGAGYEVDPTGKNKTIGVRAKIALTKNYENLYKTSYFVKDKSGNYVPKGTIAVYENIYDENKKIVGKKLNGKESFKRLNEMIRLDAWLNTDNNRKKIQLTGVRIPVQGANSAEFAQVYEFLPPSAGTIIIIPAEVVAKSGGDFDVDKLTMYLKYISKQGTLLEDTYKKPEDITAKINEVKKKLKSLKDNKLNTENLSIIDSLEDFRTAIRKTFGYLPFTKEQKEAFTNKDDKALLNTLNKKGVKNTLERMSKKLKKAYKIFKTEIEPFDVKEFDNVEKTLSELSEQKTEISKLYNELSDLKEHRRNFVSGIQNTFIDNIIKVLELPQMAFSLLLPNGTYLAKPFADELENIIKDVDNQTDYKKSLMTGKDRKTESPSVLRNYNYNLKKQQDNKTGKSILGPIVLEIPANNLLNKAGAMLNPTYVEQVLINNKIEELETPITLKLKHNSSISNITQAGEQIRKISMSDLLDADKTNQIADVLSQLANGAVDVGKDAWIAYLQGNLVAVPKILFLLEAGVPIGDIAYFMNNPYIREFIKVEQKAKSKLARVFYGPGHKQYEVIGKYVSSIIDPIIQSVKPENWQGNSYKTLWGKYTLLEKYMEKNNLTESNTFRRDALKSVAKNEANTDKKALAGFLQYMYIQELTKEHDELKKLIDVDNNTSGDNSEAEAKIAQIENAKENFRIYDKSVIDYMKNESIISSFYVQEEAVDLFGERFFSFRANKNLQVFLRNYVGNRRAMAKITALTGLTEDNFANRFKNALTLFVFNNAIKPYNPKADHYKGKKISDLFNQGSYIKNIDQVIQDFKEKNYLPSNKTSTGYLARGLYPITDNYLYKYSEDDFVELSLEREYLRKYVMPYTTDFDKSIEFNSEKKRLLRSMPNLQSTMTDQKINRLVYENMLLHKALLNTYNNYDMFSSDENTVAKKLLNIIENYKDLKFEYGDLLSRFEFPTTETKDNSNRRRNFRLKSNATLSKTEQAHFNKLWKELADPTIHKLSDESPVGMAANKYISNFFAQLPIFAFLQSGMDASSFSMNNVIPTDNFKPIMEQAAKEFTDKVLKNKSIADKFLLGFLNNFLALNSVELTGNRKYDIRGKGVNYKGTVNEFVKAASLQPEKVDVEINKKITEMSQALASEQPETKKVKLISNEDVSRFRAYLEKSAGKLPDKFFTSNTKFKVFYNEQLGRREGAPQTSMWMLNEKSLYDLVDQETYEIYIENVNLETGYQDVPVSDVQDTEEALSDGGRSYIPGPVVVPFITPTTAAPAQQAVAQPSTLPSKVKVISPDYGVVQVETNPTEEDTQKIVNLIAPQIQKQAYKENVGNNVNWQFSFGKMWSRVNLKAKPLLINSFAGVNKVQQQIENLKKEGKIVDKKKFIYDYHELDQDGNPLPSIKELQPLIDQIQNALGIDMSNYDSMLGNIYLDNQSIQPHKDTTESKSAEGYPVIVYTIGNNSSLGIWDNAKGKMTFQGAYKEDYTGKKPTNEVVTKNGSVYTFGMDGKGRFNLTHTTPLGNVKEKPYDPITLSDGRVITKYTITLTFRRAADLEPGMPTTPAKLTTTQPSTQATVSTGFKEYKGGFPEQQTINGKLYKKGSENGDPKDYAMREVANSFVVEVSSNKPSSSLTSLKTGSIIEQKGTVNHTVARSTKNLADPGSVVMLARNGSLKGTALLQETKDMIKFYHDGFNTEFVVGDMPGVDSQFIDYLQEIGAKFTIYHTGDTPRIQVKQSTQSSTTTPSANPAEFTNYHGGAKKYDTYWEQEGKSFGVTKHTVYTTDSYDKLDQTTKDKLEARYDAARTWLGRSSLSKDKYAGKLVRRDMMQAAKADAIFAVSEIVAPNIKGRKGYVNKTNHPIIEGGTGYAVASAILLGKPVYVFNQDSSYGYETGWYKWNSSTNDFVKTDIPVLTKNYAGIGSSTNETEIGRQAIRDVYANTFKPTTQPSTTLPGPETKINIYAGTGENADLSNFAERPFIGTILGGLGGQQFTSVEQAFQYAKGEFYNTYEIDPSSSETPADLQKVVDNHLKNILNAKTGAQAKALGRKNIGIGFEKDMWDDKSSEIMKKLLKESFEQNPDALAKLLATGNATLTHTQDKGKWGTEFPKLLMEVRNELKGTQPSIKTANQTFEQLYSEQDRNTILGELRNKYKEQYNQLSDAELVQRINNRLVTSDREKTIELLNKCFKQ
jgi:predicted NAD-dependent protein-ADP-ribosyltransferase YbiA (DUF1768 family)